VHRLSNITKNVVKTEDTLAKIARGYVGLQTCHCTTWSLGSQVGLGE